MSFSFNFKYQSENFYFFSVYKSNVKLKPLGTIFYNEFKV